MKKLKILFLLLSYFSFFAKGQLAVSETEMKQEFELLASADTDSAKLSICKQIKNLLTQALTNQESFEHPFETLSQMGKITSPDFKFRIYNWNCMLSNGNFRYFCILQYKKNNELKTIALNDKLTADMFSSHSPDNWFGAIYYKIIPFKFQENTHYILLGWDGNNKLTNKKIIEVLCFEESGIVFGKPVISWKGKLLNRIVFEYAKQAGMSIEYDKKNKTLVFDHLSPSSPRYQNQFEYYGPDFTYDALVFKKGIWELKEDVDIRKK